MAGKKENGATETRGESESLIARGIRGMKLPEGLRTRLGQLAKHPVVADILAAGLVALAARIKKEPTAEKATDKTKLGAGETAAPAEPAPAKNSKPKAPPKPRKPAAGKTAATKAAAKPRRAKPAAAKPSS